MAAISFSQNTHCSNPETSRKLLERIRAKIQISWLLIKLGLAMTLKGMEMQKGHAMRQESGWMNSGKRENNLKQVQTVKGNGTWHISVGR